MIKNKFFKKITISLSLLTFVFAGVLLFSVNQIEAKTYKVKVGNKTVYVRTAHGSKYAKQKAQKAFKSGKLLSSCRNVSYKCHWCRPNPPVRNNDLCPNIPGAQKSIPVGYELINGQCLQDRCLNINGFQADVPTGYVDVGGGVCQLSSDFSVSCSASKNIVKTGEDVAFTATPFNNNGSVNFVWYDGVNTSGSGNSQNSSGPVVIRKNYSSEGNQRVTVVATDSSGNRAQRTCGVAVSDSEDVDDDMINDGLLDLDGDGLPDIDLTANPNAPDITATVDLQIDRTLTNTTCKLTWSSQNAIECFLINKAGLNEKISLNGTKDVQPGEYSVRCYSPTLKITETDTKVCRLNPNIREI